MEILNHHMFTATSAFRCVAVLERDGQEIARAEMETDVPPLSSAVYPLPFGKQAEPGEYAVTVSFLLREDTPWAKAGYETAFGQGVYTVQQGDGSYRSMQQGDGSYRFTPCAGKASACSSHASPAPLCPTAPAASNT